MCRSNDHATISASFVERRNLPKRVIRSFAHYTMAPWCTDGRRRRYHKDNRNAGVSSARAAPIPALGDHAGFDHLRLDPLGDFWSAHQSGFRFLSVGDSGGILGFGGLRPVVVGAL